MSCLSVAATSARRAFCQAPATMAVMPMSMPPTMATNPSNSPPENLSKNSVMAAFL